MERRAGSGPLGFYERSSTVKEYQTLTREKVDVVPFGCGIHSNRQCEKCLIHCTDDDGAVDLGKVRNQIKLQSVCCAGKGQAVGIILGGGVSVASTVGITVGIFGTIVYKFYRKLRLYHFFTTIRTFHSTLPPINIDFFLCEFPINGNYSLLHFRSYKQHCCHKKK